MADDRSLRYSDIRARIQDGDVILFRGQGLVALAIEAGSGSRYSHSGIAMWWHRRLMLVQAERRCTLAVPLSVELRTYEGVADWYRVRDERRAGHDFGPLLDEAKVDLGLPYDFSDFMRSALHRVAGVSLPPDCESPHALFCSQYVARCFRVGGLPLVAGKADVDTTPGDISQSSVLELQGPIVLEPNEGDARVSGDW
jgi:hypothetical protein